MTPYFLFPSLLLAAGLPAWACLASGRLVPGLGLAVVGIGWVLGLGLRRWWVSIPGFLGLYGLIAAGFFLDLPAAPLVAGAFFSLVAWDLSDFAARLSLAADDDRLVDLERGHLRRLFVVALLGAGLAVLSLALKVRLDFEPLAVLIVFGVWGIGRVIHRLLQAGKAD